MVRDMSLEGTREKERERERGSEEGEKKEREKKRREARKGEHWTQEGKHTKQQSWVLRSYSFISVWQLHRKCALSND